MTIPVHRFMTRPIPLLEGEAANGTPFLAITFGLLAEMLVVPRWQLREAINGHSDLLTGTMFEIKEYAGVAPFPMATGIKIEGVVGILGFIEEVEPGCQVRATAVKRWVESIPSDLADTETPTNLLAAHMIGQGLSRQDAMDFAEGYLSGPNGELTSSALGYILSA